MSEQRLGILGGMGTPTRLTPGGDPVSPICSGQMNCPGIKVLTCGQNAWCGPIPPTDREVSYV